MNKEQKELIEKRLIQERVSLKNYIQSKLDNDEDYHAIIDAAMDIRDIDAKLEILALVEKE